MHICRIALELSLGAEHILHVFVSSINIIEEPGVWYYSQTPLTWTQNHLTVWQRMFWKLLHCFVGRKMVVMSSNFQNQLFSQFSWKIQTRYWQYLGFCQKNRTGSSQVVILLFGGYVSLSIDIVPRQVIQIVKYEVIKQNNLICKDNSAVVNNEKYWQG